MFSIRHIPTKGTLRRVLKTTIFGKRVHCPRCGSRRIKKIVREERWRCRICHRPFSITSSSWLKGTKLPLETIWLLLHCWQKKYPLAQAVDTSGVSLPTVTRWYGLFRAHIPRERLDILLGGAVACDEMYTRHQSVIGAKEKGTRNIALQVIHERSVDRRAALGFIERFVKTNVEFCTDGASIYRGIDKWHNLKHRYEIHKKFEFALTAEIEGVWGVFRTFIRRMYHHVTRYKLDDLVAEFCLRFRQDKIFASPEDYWSICLSTKPFAL